MNRCISDNLTARRRAVIHACRQPAPIIEGSPAMPVGQDVAEMTGSASGGMSIGLTTPGGVSLEMAHAAGSG